MIYEEKRLTAREILQAQGTMKIELLDMISKRRKKTSQIRDQNDKIKQVSI